MTGSFYCAAAYFLFMKTKLFEPAHVKRVLITQVDIKVQARLHPRAVSPEPRVFAHII